MHNLIGMHSDALHLQPAQMRVKYKFTHYRHKAKQAFFSLVCRSVGTLKSDDGHGNENIKKGIG